MTHLLLLLRSALYQLISLHTSHHHHLRHRQTLIASMGFDGLSNNTSPTISTLALFSPTTIRASRTDTACALTCCGTARNICSHAQLSRTVSSCSRRLASLPPHRACFHHSTYVSFFADTCTGLETGRKQDDGTNWRG